MARVKLTNHISVLVKIDYRLIQPRWNQTDSLTVPLLKTRFWLRGVATEKITPFWYDVLFADILFGIRPFGVM